MPDENRLSPLHEAEPDKVSPVKDEELNYFTNYSDIKDWNGKQGKRT